MDFDGQGTAMNNGLLNSELDASYAHCQQIARNASSSFYYSFLLLARPQRQAMCALYAFLRRTDDLGDSDAPLAERRVALRAWRQSLQRSLGGKYDDPLLPALADTIRRYGVPRECLEEVIDGVEMDLEPTHYESFDDLAHYCHRVASAVGLACLPIWGCTSSEADVPARSCGLAFQLTNILRDLKEDAQMGRVYLPREDFERFGYTPDELKAGVRNERFRDLMQFQIERAEQLYAAGSDLVSHLSADGQKVFGSMVAVYRALLAEIKRLDGDVLSRRVQLSRWKKMQIASQWFAGRVPLEATVGAATP
jgi:phytoene synthase